MRSFADSYATDPQSLADAEPDRFAFAAITRCTSIQTPEDVRAALRYNWVPLLAVVGEKDPALADAKRLAEMAPNAQLVIIPDADHLAAVTSSAYKDAVASFLKAASPAGRQPSE